MERDIGTGGVAQHTSGLLLLLWVPVVVFQGGRQRVDGRAPVWLVSSWEVRLSIGSLDGKLVTRGVHWIVQVESLRPALMWMLAAELNPRSKEAFPPHNSNRG